MDLSSILGLAAGVIGTGVAVGVAVRARQLSVPRLQLSLGHDDLSKELPRAIRRIRTTALVMGSPRQTKPHVVAVPIFIHNRGGAPVTDLSLRLQYPSAFLLRDGAAVVDDAVGRAAVFGMREAPEREVVTLHNTALVTVNVGLVRPKDTMVVTEFLGLHPLRPSDIDQDENDSLLNLRYAEIPGFQCLCPLRVFARASNTSVSADVSVFWFRASSVESLTNFGDALAKRAWDGKRPAPGVYFDPLRPFQPRRWKPTSRKERFSYQFIENAKGALPESAQAIVEGTLKAEVAVGVHEVPPWSLLGKSYDVEEDIGWLLRSHRVGLDPQDSGV
jgi:hypothetical protein